MQTLSESEYIARSIGSAHFSGEPELLLLREDLAEEWGSVIGYLECACEVRDRAISEQFLEAARDEMGHIIRLTRMLAALDQVQAKELNKAGLYWLAGFEHQVAIPAPTMLGIPKFQSEENVKKFRTGNHSSKRYWEWDDRTLECLRNAVRDELRAINAYQRQIQTTSNPSVQNLLITIMNRKKEHVAAFTYTLNKLLQEYRFFPG